MLFRDRPVLVANPRLLDGNARVPRLGARTRPQDWPLVAAALGLPEEEPSLIFETRALAVQADAQGRPSPDAARLSISLFGPWSALNVTTSPGD